MTAILAGASAVLAGIGLAEALVASLLVALFAHKRTVPLFARPPVTVLKPLHGDEPLLEEALATLCRQDYPQFQIVFGVQDAGDPAVAVVRRLQALFPAVDIALVIDPTMHGRNQKVGNLINMMAEARHDLLVIADDDVHVCPGYLDRLIAALQQPGVGLVTTLYAGLPATGLPPHAATRAPPQPVAADGVTGTADKWVGLDRGVTEKARSTLSGLLGATHITHTFLPSAVLARALGRQDCLGATMCLRRSDLDGIGGFPALVDHLADDNVLGRRIIALGLSVALADTVPLTTVPETSIRALFRHELRWARTIRALEPAGFAASVVQYPLAWALLTILLAGSALWSVGFFLISWMLRAIAGVCVDRALAPLWMEKWPAPERNAEQHRLNDRAALAFSCPVWLLPLRDVLSMAVMLASYGGRHVEWRGHGLDADTPPPHVAQPVKVHSLEGTTAR